MPVRFLATLTIVFILALRPLGVSAQVQGAIGDDWRMAREAETAYQQKDWTKAVELFARVNALNPYRGQFWWRQAYANYHLKKYSQAIPAFIKAAELGFNANASAYNVAACYARQGSIEESLRWLEIAIKRRWADRSAFWNDADFAELKRDPRFRIIAGQPPRGKVTREEAWRYDLRFLASELKRLHYDLYHEISPAELNRRIASLHKSIPRLRDHQIIAEFMRLLAAVGDGHTLMLWPTDTPYAFHDLPIRVYEFKEGLYVTATDAAHQEVLGARILRVGEATATEALDRISELIARDNSYGVLRYRYIAFGFPELLHALHLSDKPNEVRIEFRTRDGRTVNKVLTGLAPGAEVKWILANARFGKPLPLYLRGWQGNPVWNPYWFEYIPEHKAVFLQYNSCVNKSDESFSAFCERVFDFIHKNDVQKLIIDLRHNDGGSNLINKFLIQGILRTPRINQPGRLFTIVGRETFSAAISCMVDLERWTHTVFAGEPSGSSPNFIGDTTNVVLPYSRLRASISNNFWQNSVAFDDRTWLGPQIHYESTFADWIEGRDPVLDAILAQRETL